MLRSPLPPLPISSSPRYLTFHHCPHPHPLSPLATPPLDKSRPSTPTLPLYLAAPALPFSQGVNPRKRPGSPLPPLPPLVPVDALAAASAATATPLTATSSYFPSTSSTAPPPTPLAPAPASQRPVKRLRITKKDNGELLPLRQDPAAAEPAKPAEPGVPLGLTSGKAPNVSKAGKMDVEMGEEGGDYAPGYNGMEVDAGVVNVKRLEPQLAFGSQSRHNPAFYHNLGGKSSVDPTATPTTSATATTTTTAPRNSSPPAFPPLLHMKRSNPKKLSLSLPPSPSSSITPTPTDSSSQHPTPFTPGPPRTPAPALAMSMGRASMRGNRRPSLLSLITQPPAGDEVPPTPGAGFGSSSGVHPYATMRGPGRGGPGGKGRARSQTAAEMFNRGDASRGGSRSAFPLGGIGAVGGGVGVPTIAESEGLPNSVSTPGLSSLGYALPSTSPGGSLSTSPVSHSSASGSASGTGSTSTTPSTSPPLPSTFTFSVPSVPSHSNYPAYADSSYPSRSAEPYADGPIEFLPGIWLGAEESVWRWDVWARGKGRVRVVNVAQEVDDPFDPAAGEKDPGWAGAHGEQAGKGKMKLTTYPSVREGTEDDRPEVEYCHVRWSHGEVGLADLPEGARLEEVMKGREPAGREGMWKFWEAIQWMEAGRRDGVPVLLHCQCGVSRSATLAIAYTMAMAAAGTMPELLGHVRAMQDAYDFVKRKSSWIGPNHSLVFQLVDFARTLTTLLSTYYAAHPTASIPTAFPTSVQSELSEAEWARRRREFEESENGSASASGGSEGSGGRSGSEECMSPEEAGDEARRLDEAMVARRAGRF
ncbi:hypothetical protein IAT38_006066 [Cryptococcus sp. DSM 104549]